MKRRLLAGITSGLIILGCIGTAFASTWKNTAIEFDGIRLMVDGQYVEVRDTTGALTEPFVMNGTTYLPVANVASMVGYNVRWDGENKTVILELPQEQKPTYITKSGSKYHNDPNCNGGTYWEVPFSTAIGMGLEPCSKCVDQTVSANDQQGGDNQIVAGSDAYTIVNNNKPFFQKAN